SLSGNTVSVCAAIGTPRLLRPSGLVEAGGAVVGCSDVPDGENAASLGKARFLLDATNSLLEDGGDLGWSGFLVGGVRSSLYRRDIKDSWNRVSSLQSEEKFG